VPYVGKIGEYDVIAHELICNNLGDVYDHC